MTNSFQDGFLRADDGTLITVTAADAVAPVSWQDGFVRDATGALVVSGTGSGGGTAATTTFDPTGLSHTTSTNVQAAMDDYDSQFTTVISDIPDVTQVEVQAADSRGDLFQDTGTLAWPSNPNDGRKYDWHGAGKWVGDWVSGGPSGGYVVGDGINGPSGNAGVWVCTTANTDAAFTTGHWALLDMHQWDRLELA